MHRVWGELHEKLQSQSAVKVKAFFGSIVQVELAIVGIEGTTTTETGSVLTSTIVPTKIVGLVSFSSEAGAIVKNALKPWTNPIETYPILGTVSGMVEYVDYKVGMHLCIECASQDGRTIRLRIAEASGRSMSRAVLAIHGLLLPVQYEVVIDHIEIEPASHSE